MNVINIKSWKELQNLVSDLRNSGDEFLWRGQRNSSWKLSSTSYRFFESQSIPDILSMMRAPAVFIVAVALIGMACGPSAADGQGARSADPAGESLTTLEIYRNSELPLGEPLAVAVDFQGRGFVYPGLNGLWFNIFCYEALGVLNIQFAE